jgi:hypothetical protein
MIEEVGADAVIGVARASLGLPFGGPVVPDEPYIAAAVRRLAGFLCPCSPRTLLRAAVESHRGLVPDEAAFGELIEATIEALIAIGDLLEIGDVALEGDEVKGTWLVAAPPAFVARESGSVFILGLSADEQTPLPMEMRSRVELGRAIRSIDPLSEENLPAVLRDLGLRELSSASWLRTPKPVSAASLVAGNDAKVAILQASGEIPDLLVLDGGRNTRSYKRRWTPPGSLTGNFVVRRPQTFGADLWGYAQLRDGAPVKVLDLPLYGERWRGCDAAWRIQMAIDALAGRPQEYRLDSAEGGSRFDFFSPIPAWARRRLAVIGQELEPAGCLMSFFVPVREVDTEMRFLNEMLYLSRTDE